MTSLTDFQALFDAGVRSYEIGQRETALVQFQQALALAPQHLQAIAACATLLSELGQPQASYQLLVSKRDLLWNDADGVTNLAVGAEALGHHDEAAAAYHQALALDPNQTRALNNLALRHAHAGRWAEATEAMQRCARLAPAEPRFWSNWIDFLNGAKRDEEALSRAEEACERFPQNLDLLIRRFACLAFNGHIEQATEALADLGSQPEQVLRQYLVQAGASLPKPFQKHILVTPDAFEFYSLRAFDALNVCDWRRNDALTRRLLDMVQQVQRSSEIRDWRDTQFYAMFLELDEQQQLDVREVTVRGFLAQREAAAPWHLRHQPRSADSVRRDPRLRIGISPQFLGNTNYREGLLRQLQLHDRSQFAFFIYSPAAAEAAALLPFQALQIPIIEIGHMTDSEAVGRMRLDHLDLWMDDAMYTVWCRPELPILGVAPLHTRRQTWCRIHPSPHFTEYGVGDTFTHPLGGGVVFGDVIRFPTTCWLHTGAMAVGLPTVSRQAVGLPDDALVLAVNQLALAIDPFSFAQWMRMLVAIPRALLLLPPYAAAARANLAKAAQVAGVDPLRLRYVPRPPEAIAQAELQVSSQAIWQLADLALDTLRFNATQTLADMLQLGVPALTVAGNTMASRLGGSIVSAAGLGDCVLDSANAYVSQVVHLANHPAELVALRRRLASQLKTAALFDASARLREWEAAWRHMVARQRAGLPPASFDVKILV